MKVYFKFALLFALILLLFNCTFALRKRCSLGKIYTGNQQRALQIALDRISSEFDGHGTSKIRPGRADDAVFFAKAKCEDGHYNCQSCVRQLVARVNGECGYASGGYLEQHRCAIRWEKYPFNSLSIAQND